MPDESTAVALLASGETLPSWSVAALERMLAETNARITLVVEDASAHERTTVESLRRLVELREWGVVAAAMELLGSEPEPLERRSIRSLDGIEGAEWIRCEPETVDGWKHALPGSAVARLAETDVAVRFGFGFLVGDALTAPDLGVLSFHHGDLREYRGQPMGFWEYVHGRDEAGVTLQRINETLDAGEVVATRSVDIADAPTWRAVRERLFEASTDLLAEGVRRLRCENFEPERVPAEELGDLYTLPKGRPVATFLRKTARGLVSG